ncbi:MAG: methyltransferase, TIGR04325 family [Pseudomonadales bacterium]|nr:methyltransferase, TIGR04325 family [Pseudomonadales bacterium]
MAKPKYFYEGFYKSFAEAAPVEKGFAGNRRLESLQARLASVRSADWDTQEPLDSTLLAVLSKALSQHQRTFRLLDVGGGLGATCFWLSKTLGEDFGRLNYSVLDIPAVIDHANSTNLQESLGNLSFHKEFPAESFDLVNFGSSLHYFESPEVIIATAAKTNATHLVFTRTPVCQKGTFVTLQNYYESRIPVTVLGIDDLNAWCGEFGFTLLSESASAGNTEPFPISGIPEDYRLTFASDLVFGKS